MHPSLAAVVVVMASLCACTLAAEGEVCVATSTPAAAGTAPTPPSTLAPAATPGPTTPTAAPGPPAPRRLTLAGVRPMTDRSNSSEPVPCTCGIFLSSRTKGQGGQPEGLPAISHEFRRAAANTAGGIRQCTTSCVDMIVKHLPNSASILCSSIERDCTREKAFLYIKNYSNKWRPTRLSAGKEFCCKGGVAVRCPVTEHHRSPRASAAAADRH